MSESIQVTRDLIRPVDRIWQAWTDPGLLVLWICPNPDMSCEVALDGRPGGNFRLRIPGEYSVEGTVLGAEKPTRLSLSWLVSSPNPRWTVLLDPAEEPSQVHISLTGTEIGTRLVVDQVGIADEPMARELSQMWNRALGRLTGIL